VVVKFHAFTIAHRGHKLSFMETTELRSKEEIVREIEANRRDVKTALRGTKYAWTGGNPAVRAWKATKSAAVQTKERIADGIAETKNKVSVKAEFADTAIRDNVYKSIGMALCAGTLIGYLTMRKFRAKKKARC